MTNKTNTYKAQVVNDPVLDAPVIQLQYENEQDRQKNIAVEIAPTYGSNLFAFRVGEHEVFFHDKETLKKGLWTGCFILGPLPNRYDLHGSKAFEFEGLQVSLEGVQRKEGNNPLIHGLVDDQKWEYENLIATEENASARTTIVFTKDHPQYQFFPYEHSLTLHFTVTSEGVTVTYTVTNNSEKNMPYVFALHPYYALLSGREKTRVRIPARGIMEATEELLPTGIVKNVKGTKYDLQNPTPVKGMFFDDVWTDLISNENTYIEYPEQSLRIRHKVTDDFTHVVMFTQMEQHGFICLEPQTGATNAINLYTEAQRTQNEALEKAAHLLVIPPGQTHTGQIQFLVEYVTF